jgi:hypothetical protein
MNVAVTDSFPCSAVAFAGRVAALELLVVLFHDLGVLLAINAVRQVWAAGIAARSLWFSWHKPCLLSGIKKALQGVPARLVCCACSCFFILFADYILS